MTDWNNKEEVLEAVKEDGTKLENASEELRNDREVVMTAVKQYGAESKEITYDFLQLISKDLRADKEVIMAVIKNNGYALEQVSKELQSAIRSHFSSDKELVMVALANDESYDSGLFQDGQNARNAAIGGISLSYTDGSNFYNLNNLQHSSIHFSHKNKYGGLLHSSFLV